MVKMSSKLLFGKDSMDIREGINFARMRDERSAKAKKVLKQRGIPAILVTGEPNVRYLTSFTFSEFQPFLSYTLFFAEHDPIVFAHAGSYHQMPDQAPWIKNWRIARSWLQGICGHDAAQREAELFAQEIYNELKERGLQREKLGMVSFDFLSREALKRQGIIVVEGSELLLEASKTKTQDEINCLKIAASFGTSGWTRALEVLKPGVDTSQVMREVLDSISVAGATVSRGFILSGPMTFERNISYPTRRIEYGDLVYMPLCGTSYMGYTACMYRQFIVGRKPTQKEKDWFKKMKERLDVAIDATKIGASTADIAKAAFPPASIWGYKDEVEVLSVEIGHGIGLVGIDGPCGVHYNMPVINRQWSLEHPQIIEEGMVIAYESLEGEHRVGGVRMENMVVVTQNGAEIIDHFPRDEILVAGGI
jgi:Xaa-Pro dipeptidase